MLPAAFLLYCWGSQGLSESDLFANQAKSFLFARFVFLEQQANETNGAVKEFQQWC